MRCIDYVVFYFEFIFQNYCVYVYLSALFIKIRKWQFISFLLVFVSITEFFVYFLNNAVLNMTLFIIMTFVIIKLVFNSGIIQGIIHSFIYPNRSTVTE